MLEKITEKYLSVPYKDRGRSLDEGFDCYGLVMDIARTYLNTELPDPYYDLSNSTAEDTLIENGMHDWVEKINISDIQPFDFVMIRGFASKLGTHIGVYVGSDTVLHAAKPRVLAHRLSRLSKYIIGVYRLKNDKIRASSGHPTE